MNEIFTKSKKDNTNYIRKSIVCFYIIYFVFILVSCDKEYLRYQQGYIYDQLSGEPVEGLTMALVKHIERDTVYNGKQTKYYIKQPVATCRTNRDGRFEFNNKAWAQSTTLALIKTVPFDSTITEWKYQDWIVLSFPYPNFNDNDTLYLFQSGMIFFQIANLNNRKIEIRPEAYPPNWEGINFPESSNSPVYHLLLEPGKVHNFNIFLRVNDQKQLLETQSFYVKNAYKPGSKPGGFHKEIFKTDTITVYLQN